MGRLETGWPTTTTVAGAGRGSTSGVLGATPAAPLVTLDLDPRVLVVLVLFNYLAAPRPNTIDYSQFLGHVENGEIVGTLEISQTSVSGTFQDTAGEQDFTTTIPPILQGTSQLTEQLNQAGISYTGVTPSGLQAFLIGWVAPLLLFGLLWFFLIRRMSGAGRRGPQPRTKQGQDLRPQGDEDDVRRRCGGRRGQGRAPRDRRLPQEPEEIPASRRPDPQGRAAARPPGCGKTLLARAVAGEANVPFFFMSGSEFVEMFVGLGAARMRELFQQAKDKAPALVFLDEIDTIGKGRGGAMGAGFGGHDEREQTLNQLLVEMDGFDASKGVIIMAATNRPDVLDPALVRPGRFDRQVVVDRPDLRGREAILQVHVRGVALDPSVELQVLAARTPGSPAPTSPTSSTRPRCSPPGGRRTP